MIGGNNGAMDSRPGGGGGVGLLCIQGFPGLEERPGEDGRRVNRMTN